MCGPCFLSSLPVALVSTPLEVTARFAQGIVFVGSTAPPELASQVKNMLKKDTGSTSVASTLPVMSPKDSAAIVFMVGCNSNDDLNPDYASASQWLELVQLLNTAVCPGQFQVTVLVACANSKPSTDHRGTKSQADRSVDEEGWDARFLQRALLWGMVRTGMREHPKVSILIVGYVTEDVTSPIPDPLAHELTLAGPETEPEVLYVNLEETHRFVRRLTGIPGAFGDRGVKAAEADHLMLRSVKSGKSMVGGTRPSQATRTEHAWYVVTGGSSGIGVLTSRWLVRQGARKIFVAQSFRGGYQARSDLRRCLPRHDCAWCKSGTGGFGCW